MKPIPKVTKPTVRMPDYVKPTSRRLRRAVPTSDGTMFLQPFQLNDKSFYRGKYIDPKDLPKFNINRIS